MAKRKQAPPKAIYQLKIGLKGLKPPVWRRIQVADATTLNELHLMIQEIMDWENYHLHQFTIGRTFYGQPQPDYGLEFKNENPVKLSQVISGEKFKFLYTYDFGDDWEHEILVEKILPPADGVSYPICLTGKRACPPEDCGGIWGYKEMLEALQDPEHPEYETYQDWIDEDFDPEAFDLDEINQRLKRFRSNS
jgi:hypothetical protein